MTRSTRRPHGPRATSGGTESGTVSPRSAAIGTAPSAAIALLTTKSPQITGSASGNVMSRATPVGGRVTTTVKATTPTTRSSSTKVNDHHVDACRHGRNRSRITPRQR